MQQEEDHVNIVSGLFYSVPAKARIAEEIENFSQNEITQVEEEASEREAEVATAARANLSEFFRSIYLYREDKKASYYLYTKKDDLGLGSSVIPIDEIEKFISYLIVAGVLNGDVDIERMIAFIHENFALWGRNQDGSIKTAQ